MSILFFFFSSRRRHTRCGRDWSSDVCSSDLGFADRRDRRVRWRILDQRSHGLALVWGERRDIDKSRSEERRVGKECRGWGLRDHLKKKRTKSQDRGQLRVSACEVKGSTWTDR